MSADNKKIDEYITVDIQKEKGFSFSVKDWDIGIGGDGITICYNEDGKIIQHISMSDDYAIAIANAILKLIHRRKP